ncbi:MAG: hypothetical protein JWO52_3843 [Gammaproteobacteria bacterium]|nr:hypothetical protein [Gammaproteobacteria bacterium]
MQERSKRLAQLVVSLGSVLTVLLVLGWVALLAYWALRAPHAASAAAAEFPSKDLSAWLTALGTCGAVFVALWQLRGAREEAASQRYFERAELMLRTVVSDFISRTDVEGRPVNDRRHWLNFARGLNTAASLAAGIRTPELKRIWIETEHYWRERVYDVLQPQLESFPADYYGYTKPDEIVKNFAQGKGERAPLSEPSLVFVYRWIKWPKDRSDNLDRQSKFSDDEVDEMELFGPRGLAKFIRIQRDPKAHEAPAAPRVVSLPGPAARGIEEA